jgi:hypothetical protein
MALRRFDSKGKISAESGAVALAAAGSMCFEFSIRRDG